MVDINVVINIMSELEVDETMVALKDNDLDYWKYEDTIKRYREYLRYEKEWGFIHAGKPYPYTFEGD